MTTSHPNRPPRVVVGVDGSESSKRALAWAAYIADSTGAVVEAVTSWMFPLSYGWAVALTESPADSMEKVLTETVDEIFGPQRPDDMRLIIREGHAAKVLLDVSEGAVMLVVGSRGHGGFAGLLLGSVSASVAEHATCPVLVVHGDHLPPKGSA
jgi:nucleotide-binding universal stress UspA family protein